MLPGARDGSQPVSRLYIREAGNARPGLGLARRGGVRPRGRADAVLSQQLSSPHRRHGQGTPVRTSHPGAASPWGPRRPAR
jgi:hypothetical protein